MLISMAVQVSEEHGNSLGLDTAAIQSYGGGWVITSYEGSFAARQPINGEELILGTRAIANNRFFALREFWIQSADRQVEYVRLTGLFVYMNLQTRHLMSIPQAVIEPYHGPERSGCLDWLRLANSKTLDLKMTIMFDSLILTQIVTSIMLATLTGCRIRWGQSF